MEDILQINLQDIDHSFNLFSKTVNHILDEISPLKKNKINKNISKRTKSNPWITNGILTSIHNRDGLYKRFIREKNPTTKFLLQERLKKYRNKISLICRLSKSNYYKKIFQ